MRQARIVGMGLTAVAAATMLTACEKPPPAISVFSGTTTINEEALCWAFDSDNLAPGQCAQDVLQGRATDGTVPTLPIESGNVVGISVDPVVAESGWTPAVAGQQIVSSPLTETYFRFTVPLGSIPDEGVPMQIVAGQNQKVRGVWVVKLVP